MGDNIGGKKTKAFCICMLGYNTVDGSSQVPRYPLWVLLCSVVPEFHSGEKTNLGSAYSHLPVLQVLSEELSAREGCHMGTVVLRSQVQTH